MNVLRLSAFCSIALFCGACVTVKHGVFDILHTESINPNFEVQLLRHEDSVRFYSEFKGRPICEMEVDPRGTRSVVSSYCSPVAVADEITIVYDGSKMSTIRWTTTETNTVVLYDRDGDGYPEMRTTSDGMGRRIVETLKPVVQSSVEKQGDGGESPD